MRNETKDKGDQEGRAKTAKGSGAHTLGPFRPGNLDCSAYERLVTELETREPTMQDFDRLAAHEASCPTSKHSEAGVEEALSLPRGALRCGSPDHHLPSPKDLIARLIKRYL